MTLKEWGKVVKGYIKAVTRTSRFSLALMPHLYGHKYLGPGSSLDKEEVPLDIDDFYALIHDIAYEVANNRDDIRQADRTAILDFLGDFIANSNWHSILGASGLATKYGIETVVGVLYPQISRADGMPPVKDWAKIKRIQQAVNAKLEKEGKPPRYTFGKDKVGKTAKGKFGANTKPKQSKPSTTTTTKDPFEGDDSWVDQVPDQVESPPPKKQRVADDPIGDLDRIDQLLDAVGGNQQSSEPSVQSNDGVVPGTSGQHQVESNQGNSNAATNMDTMDVDGEAVNPGGGQSRVVSANSGGGSSASGGAGQNQSYIRGPYRSIGTGRLSFQKRFRFRAYGYAWNFRNISALDNSTPTATQRVFAKGLNTSLIYIPTDYLPMYMSQAEWTTLNACRRVSVESCQISIIPAGYNVSFDTNATLSGAASATHFVEAKFAKGINTTFPCRAVKYTSTATKPMVIDSVNQITDRDIIDILYASELTQANVQGNSWPWYTQFVQHHSNMDYTYFDADNFGEWNSYGSMWLSSHMSCGALQGMLNMPLGLSFTPKLGIIFNQFQNPGFPLDGTKWQDQNQWFLNANEVYSKGEYDAATKKRKHVMTTRLQSKKALTVNASTAQADDASNEPFVWRQRIDKSGQMGWLCGEGPTRTQIPPVLMFGISPIKVSLPSAAEDSFVQAHVDFYMETSMDITIDNSGIGSLWPCGNFKDCLYGASYVNQTTTYGEISTLGLMNTVTGKTSKDK